MHPIDDLPVSFNIIKIIRTGRKLFLLTYVYQIFSVIKFWMIKKSVIATLELTCGFIINCLIKASVLYHMQIKYKPLEWSNIFKWPNIFCFLFWLNILRIFPAILPYLYHPLCHILNYNKGLENAWNISLTKNKKKFISQQLSAMFTDTSSFKHGDGGVVNDVGECNERISIGFVKPSLPDWKSGEYE